MRARTALAVLILASILPAAAGRSLADGRKPSTTLDQAPQAIVTSGWAGIWQVVEETRDCTTGQLVGTSSFLDTLCTGDAFFLMVGESLTRGGYVYPTCSGPGFTDTSLNLTCSVGGICGCMGTCGVGYTMAAQWTRIGDQVATSLTSSAEYSAPGGCAPPNSCHRTTGTRTRISSGAAVCGGVPTLPKTWGSLKILYR